MQLQRVTQVIETDTVSQLGVEQAYDVAPGIEGAGLLLGSGVARDFGNQMLRNKIANLAQEVEFASGWNSFELIHPCRVAGANKKFQPILSNPVGWL
jgi:hypothetical protein